MIVILPKTIHEHNKIFCDLLYLLLMEILIIYIKGILFNSSSMCNVWLFLLYRYPIMQSIILMCISLNIEFRLYVKIFQALNTVWFQGIV
jgi:hypothetical protein